MFSGSKGGGGSSFKQTPDNLRSNDTFEGVLGLAVGPLKGPTRGLKSIKIDGTAIENTTGELNFQDFVATFADGDPLKFPQKVQLKLGAGGSPVQIGLALSNDGGTNPVWVTRTLNNTSADFIDLRFIVQQLFRQTAKGIYETTATIEIQLKPVGSTTWVNPTLNTPTTMYDEQGGSQAEYYRHYIPEINYNAGGQYQPGPSNYAITGKTSSPAVYELRIAVPNEGNYANKAWDVRARLLERESYTGGTDNADQEQRSISWESMAAVYSSTLGEHEDWRGVSWLQIYGKASDQLTGVPEVTGEYDTKLVSVPATVYNPETRQYTGAVWDGSWAKAYTADPAWIINDAIVDPLSGISLVAAGSYLNKWDALELSKWCSELVPDGNGGFHPRYSMNIAVAQPQKAEEFIRYLAGAVGALAWDQGDGEWRAKIDKADAPVDIFTLDSIDGEFVYSHTDVDTRFNDITGQFKNAEMDYRQDAVQLFDNDSIALLGRKPTTIALVGCTNRQEALRRVKLRLRASVNESRIVTFTTNRRGRSVEPLSTILIADGDLGDQDKRTTGRTISVAPDRLSIVVRDPIYIAPGVAYTLRFTVPNSAYSPETATQPSSGDWTKPTVVLSRNVTNTSGQRGSVTTIYLDEALPSIAADNLSVALEATNLATLPRLFRVTSVVPQDDGERISISAINVDTEKQAASDGVSPLDSVFQDLRGVIPPPSVVPGEPLLSLVRVPIEQGQQVNLQASFMRPAGAFLSGFRIQYSVNGGALQTAVERQQLTEWELPNAGPGVYHVEVCTIDRRGGYSQPLTGQLEVTQSLIDATEIFYIDPDNGTPLVPINALKPREAGADVTGDNTALDTINVHGRGSENLLNQVDATIAGVSSNSTAISNILVDIDDLVTTYGSTASAANSAAAALASANTAAAQASAASSAASTAATHASAAGTAASNASQAFTDANAAKNAAQSARDLAQNAQVGAETAYTQAVSAKNAAQDAQAVATQAKLDAQSAQGAAATSATSAASSATSASGSQSAALTSANLSAAAYQSTLALDRNGFFINGLDGWETSGTWSTHASFAGRVNTVRSAAGVASVVISKHYPIANDNQVWKLKASFRSSGGTDPVRFYLGYTAHDAAGVILTATDGTGNYPISVANTFTQAQGWIDREVTISRGSTTPAPYGGTTRIPAGAATFRLIVFSNYDAANVPADIDYFYAEDVTSEADSAASATASASSASSALASATAAGQFASAANSSALAAQTAQSAASTNASNAAASATNAAGSASTATTQAGLAATARSGAESARDVAQGHSSAANTSASNASASATSAGNSATTASTQALAASSSYRNTVLIGGNQTFADGLTGWQDSHAVGSAPITFPLEPVSVSGWSATMVRLTSNNTAYVFTEKMFSVDTTRKYRISGKIGAWVSGGNGSTKKTKCYIGVACLDAAGTLVDHGAYGSYRYSAAQGELVGYNEFLAFTAVMTGEGNDSWVKFAPGTKQVRLMALLNYDDGSGLSPLNTYLDYVTIEDVTSEIAAETSATAAATQASVATTQANAASSSASAAQTSATNAATQAGNAATSASQASTSATNAAGSASTASTQATNAANSATAAAGSASAASGSASTASTQATNASNSASAALSSSVSAASSAGTATTKATEAAGSAVSAASAASAASTSASTAATHASNAGTSASSASSAANTASTQAGNASNSASAASGAAASASTSASNAASSASTALSYSRLSAAYAANGSYLNTNATFNEDTLQGWYVSNGAYHVHSDYGTGVLTNAGASAHIEGSLVYIDTTKEYTLDVRAWGSGVVCYYGLSCFNAAGTRIANVYTTSSGSTITGHLDFAHKFRGVGGDNWLIQNLFLIGTVSVRPVAYVNYTNVGGGYGYVWNLGLKQTESEYQAATSASIATTQATNASASASSAASNATLTAGYRDTASGHASSASSSASAASGSAAAASSSASSAASSATLSASYRDTAAGHASSAASSASAASGSATTASAAASSATSSATLTATMYQNSIIGNGNLSFEFGFDGWSQWADGSAYNWASDASVMSTGLAWGVGRKFAIAQVGNARNIYSRKTFPVVTNRKYRIKCKYGSWYNGSSGRTARFYVGFIGLGASGEILDHGAYGSYRYALGVGPLVADGTLIQGDVIVTGEGNDSWYKFPPGTKSIRLLAFMNHPGSPATQDVATYIGDWEVVDVTETEALSASVTTQAGAIATLEGKVVAYLVNTVVAGTSRARVSLFAKNEAGNAASLIDLSADTITLGGMAGPVLEIVSGQARVNGVLSATTGIALGTTGNTWPVALRAKDYTVADGTVVAFGLNLGALPQLDFSTAGLDALASGESYNLYADSLTATGFTARLKIATPGTPSTITLTTDTTPGTGPTRQIDKASNADSQDGNYELRFQGNANVNNIPEAGEWFAGGGTTTVTIWAKKSGTWQSITTEDIWMEGAYGSATTNRSLDITSVYQLGSGVEAFGVTIDAGYGISSPTLTDFVHASWVAPGTPSGTRTATPGGRTSKVTVRPQ